MFKIFNKREPKANWNADPESVAGLEDYYKEHAEKFAEFDAALQPLRDKKSKAVFIISQIYARHGIYAGKYNIYDYCLDNEVFTDLCTFSEDELVSLRKWTQRYKELETEIMKLCEKYSNDMKGEVK